MREPLLSELFVSQYNVLLSFAFQLARNEDDALDLMQDLAEVIARNDRPLNQISNPMAFFRKCLRNNRINIMKKAAREVSEAPEIIAINPAKEDVESRLAYRELAQWLRKELSTYSPEMQEAFKMYYLDGYSLEEVAQQLGIRKNTLSQRFLRMRNKLTNDALADSVILALVVLFITQSR